MSISVVVEVMIVVGGCVISMLKLISVVVVEITTMVHIMLDTSSSSMSMPVGRCFMVFFLDMK